MGGQEGGRWDVGVENNAVHLERISDDDERLFDDSLTSDEARALAGLLEKYADKLDASKESAESDDDDDEDEDDDDEDDEDEDDDEDDDDDDNDNDNDDDEDDESEKSGRTD